MQTPAPFEYERATSVDHAIALLERHGPEARLVAGGHSLLPMMKLRLARPEELIDINDLTDLDYIRVEGGEIAIGAMTRHRELLSSPLLAEHYRIFAEAERVIADPIVRNRGTVGGSLCQADPSEDLSAVGAGSRRRWCPPSSGSAPSRAASSTSARTRPPVGPAEILTEIRVPIRASAGSAYEKVERRAGDWAIAAAGAFVQLDGDVAVRLRHRSDRSGRRALHVRRGGGPPAGQAGDGREHRCRGTTRHDDCHHRPTSAVRPTTSGISPRN